MTLTVPEESVDMLVALQAAYAARGKRYKLTFILMDLIQKGDQQVRRSWKYGEDTRNLREFQKKAASMFDASGHIKDTEALRLLAIEHGMVKGVRLTPDVESTEDVELTDSELEKATAPEV